MGREDCKLRSERAWLLRQQNVEQRKALDVELMQVAMTVADLAEGLPEQIEFLPENWRQDKADESYSAREYREAIERLTQLRTELVGLHPQVVVFAIDEAVAETAGSLLEKLAEILVVNDGDDLDTVRSLAPDLVDEAARLLKAVRQDLGLDGAIDSSA